MYLKEVSLNIVGVVLGASKKRVVMFLVYSWMQNNSGLSPLEKAKANLPSPANQSIFH